jgi:hypothetical protein
VAIPNGSTATTGLPVQQPVRQRLADHPRRRLASSLHAAALLAGRFNPVVSAIKSWDWMVERPYP